MIKNIFAIFAIFCSAIGIAQKNSSSPYSFFGIGDPLALKSVEETSMGRIGGAMDSPYRLSLTNPASYASLLYTTYVFAGANNWTNFDDGTDQQTSSNASFTYIALGIPMKGNQGLALGLQLNTAVGYTVLSFSENEEGIINERTDFEGSGGTNRAFLGYGYKFPFNLMLGAEAAYIFGGLNNSVTNRRLGVQLGTKYKVDSYVDGFEFKVGAQYNVALPDELMLKMGASATLSHELTEDGNEILYSINNTNTAVDIPVDTLYNNPFKSAISYPLKSVLSAGLGKENTWYAGLEYEFMDALDVEGAYYQEQDVYQYQSNNRISLGGYYIPNFNAIGNYWQRITYRAGFHYRTLGLNINGTDINDYGISFGVGLPVGLQLSNVNFGFELGQRGEKTNNLIQENYFNFRLSLSLSDKWFRKRQLN